MEKISAICAMGWSVELEKGLRSKRPGCPIESIKKMGPRLIHWSMEPQLTMPVYNMLGLVPGEDRVFADSIILRLAESFVSGDNVTKIAIINVFLSTARQCQTKHAQEHGIFSGMSMEIKLELLRRVKPLLNAECIKSRALSFILFGCWADITKDIVEIRHAILSTLVSCHVLEVKASLFAAGCLSEVSNDFGSVFLERLLVLMSSPKTLPVLKIAGAQALSKINYSIILVIKSYKAGAELVRKFSEEDIVAVMLVSLTKLSSKAGILISEQVGLLSSFLSQEASFRMQATALRCMVYLVEKATHVVTISGFAFQTLFRIFDEPNIPSPMRCDVLRIFLKILAYWLPDVQLTDVSEVMKLLRYAEGATRSSFLSERLLAFEILVCLSNKLKGRPELGISETFLSGVLSAVSNQIAQLISLALDATEGSKVEQELRSMLRFLLVLVGNHSELSCCVLDKLYSIIENTVNSHSMLLQDSAVHKIVNTIAEGSNFFVRVFMFQIHRFLVAFLEIMGSNGAAIDQVLRKLKDLVTFVCGSRLFDCSIHTFYALLLSHGNRVSLSAEDKSSSGCVHGISETQIHECALNMLAGGDNWYAYRAGKYAACEGALSVADMIFQHLETRVQSQFCCQWLKFLVHFASLEKNAQMLLQQASHSWSLNKGHEDAVSGGYIEKLFEVCGGLSSLDKVFEAISTQAQTLHFQRWVLAFRVKVLLMLADILKLLDSIKQSGVDDANDGNSLAHHIKYLGMIASKLTRLAEECDLITSSFIDMDSNSVKVLSSLALSCAMLGFCMKFTSLMVNSFVSRSPTENFGDFWYVLVQDLARRLCYADSEILARFISILKDFGLYENSLHLLQRFQFSKIGCISEDILAVCRWSVEEMIQLRNRSQCVQNKDTAPQVFNDCMQLLRNIVASLTYIHFRIPKYFFRVRPSIGAVLISSGSSCRKQGTMLASLGSHLSLNLHIQLKGVPSDTFSISKVYCILYCKTSFVANQPLAPCEGVQAGYQPSKIDMMIDLNKKLQHYVLKQTREFSNCGDNTQNNCETEAYVCFETEGRAQGFSTCLLDVSSFPVGSYRIHWHSGFVDNNGAFWSLLPLSPAPVFTVG